MIRRRGKANRLLSYLLNRKLIYYRNGSSNGNSRNRSLYIALVFAAFFALMIILQILSIEKTANNNNNNINSYNNNDMNFNDMDKENGILGRFRLFSKKSDDKSDLIFGPKVVQELDRIFDIKHNAVDVVLTQTNQSNNIYENNHNKDVYSGATVDDHWQEVSHSRHKFFVYSAYYDDRNRQNRFIRIIAATKTRTDERVYCKLWFANTYEPMRVNAVNKLIHENWNLKYSAYFILCPLFAHLPVPVTVSLFIRDNSNDINEQSVMHSNKLLIHNNVFRGPLSGNDSGDNHNNDLLSDDSIAVCIKPLHYDYNKVLNLIEFIELNRILGVKHFFLYNHTIGREANCALHKYIASGLVTMQSWTLDMESQKEIRTEGLFAALNDCLYRTANRYKYALMIDIDELIIPYRHTSLSSMLQTMSRAHGDRTGAYSFRNAFFYSQWPDDRSVSTAATGGYRLQTLLKTRRKSQLNLHKQRSKCIVMPDKVVEMGNHFVWEFLPTKLMVNVDPRLAVLHHYRVCEFGGDDCVKTASFVERRVHYWKEELILSVTDRINQWSNYCNFDDVLNKIDN